MPGYSDTYRQAGARLKAGLKQLHRLSTTNYDTLDQVFSDYLKTGCDVFRTQLGVLLQVDNGDTVVRAIHGASATLRRGSRIPLRETHWAAVADRLRTYVSTHPAEPLVHPRGREATPPRGWLVRDRVGAVRKGRRLDR